MIKDHDLMRRVGFLVAAAVAVLAAACTKPNPRSCADGTCTDPAFPFCDVDGTLGETTNTCIAVECTPDTFEACRGDQAITCNATGNDFDLIQCERGCDDASGGCRLCDPNETACTNGTVATCDANGAVVSTEPCPLGCFEAEPRCREIDPSNNLGAFLDMVPDPPELSLSNAVFETGTGLVRVGETLVDVPSFTASPAGNGVPIRVFVVGSLQLTSATVQLDSGDPRGPSGAGFALLSRGAITITGEILVEARVGSAVAGCAAGSGKAVSAQAGFFESTGGGGGGNATDGASGGAIVADVQSNLSIPAAVKDPASGTSVLVPLRGGCSGGYVDRSGSNFATGGGAVQISSRTSIEIDATIDLRGTAMLDISPQGQFLIGGAGAGGSLLLEAPSIAFGADAKLLATGGKGAQACTMPVNDCTAGGAGATPETTSTAGTDVMPPFTGKPLYSGGGGGGLGRIRINTPDQTFTTANTTVLAGSLSTGTLQTR